MDSKQMVGSYQYNTLKQEDMDKNRLGQHNHNSSLEECMISKHLEVGMDRNWLVLVGNCNSRKKSQKWNNSNLKKS